MVRDFLTAVNAGVVKRWQQLSSVQAVRSHLLRYASCGLFDWHVYREEVAQVCRRNDLHVYLTSGMIKAPSSASVGM